MNFKILKNKILTAGFFSLFPTLLKGTGILIKETGGRIKELFNF